LTKKTEKALDEIFGGPPADFIKSRNALAKRLKDDGDAEDAERVKALRKPSKAAAVLNALALDDPKSVESYLDLADKLRDATSGKVDAKRMRELAREEGELLEELVAKAGDLGDGASASTLDRVRETLQAAQVDAELSERVVSGRVEREERAASVGLDNLAGPPVAPRRKKAAEKKPEKANGQREAAAARKRKSEAKAELKAAQAEAREAAREVARAESALAKAERARDAADGKVERAEAKLEKLG
jgi:hypothetical protein